jgi:hypothetical protein
MKTRILLIALALLCAPSLLMAAKIYKWVDADGNVHYGERPPSNQAQELNIRQAPPSPKAAAPTSDNRLEATTKLLESMEKDRQQKAEAQKKSAEEQRVRTENCSRARKRVAGLRIGGRQFEMTEAGERHYLDDAEVQKRLKEAEAMVKKWCQ